MSVLNTTRLNQIIHHLQSVYNTYDLPTIDWALPTLSINVTYNNLVTNDLTTADTSTVGDWPIRPVKITARIFLDQSLYPDMLDQPTAQLCNNQLEIKHTFSVGDAIASLCIYCQLPPADLALLESMGVTKKEYISSPTYTHTCSLSSE